MPKNSVGALTLFLFLLSTWLLLTQASLAQLGAGVSLGTISVDRTLTPGGIYKLPRLPVINTGEISAKYTLRLLPLTTESGFLAPKASWFRFSPAQFDPPRGASRLVNVSPELPFDASVGKYAALFEALASLTKGKSLQSKTSQTS